ncbi:hypothetical protein phiOC_p304 [Ochrobactrum phage vB_OspM_OC]|nr:hypothetical protein phiOC_p304 [Ochrobactrum phage vB_OspM_OC]
MVNLADIVFEMNKIKGLGMTFFISNGYTLNHNYKYIGWKGGKDIGFTFWIPDFLFNEPDKSSKIVSGYIKYPYYYLFHYSAATSKDYLKVEEGDMYSFHYYLNSKQHVIVCCKRYVMFSVDGITRAIYNKGSDELFDVVSYVFQKMVDNHRKLVK